MSAESYTVTLDDDPMIARLIEAYTEMPTRAFTSYESLQAAQLAPPPAAIFVDIHLGVDECGLDWIPDLRRHWPHAAILVVTSDKSGAVIGTALAAGANDFVRKPLARDEVKARVTARIIEMATFAERDALTVGDVTLVRRHRRLESGAAQRHLSTSLALFFETLALAGGAVVTKDELKRRVWGQAVVSDGAFDRKVSELRALLKDVSATVKIKTVYGVGLALEIAGAGAES